jgi:hypothetical protein
MCGGLPTPAVPIEALSGLALSQAMKDLRSVAGVAFLATSTIGAAGSSITGSKSFVMSYCSE